MSTNRKRTFGAGWVSPSALPKGPNGRALCRWCQTEVPPRRQTFCSQACVNEWTVRTSPSSARAQVARRDHGVCARCGLDTEYLRETAAWLWRLASRKWRFGKDCTGRWPLGSEEWAVREREESYGDRRAAEALDRLQREYFGRRDRDRRSPWYVPDLTTDHLWEADHIIPVVEGGGECGLDGLRTLCLPCHRIVTNELRRRLAFRRTNGSIARHNAAHPAHQIPLLDVPVVTGS